MLRKLQRFLFLISILTLFSFTFFWFVLPTLKPKTGSLSVKTPFQNSIVYLDSKKLGQTPLESRSLRLGDHSLKIEADGTSWETKTTLGEHVASTLTLNLSKENKFTSGEHLFFRANQVGLSILSTPSGAKVFLNGQEKGKTPFKVDLSEGAVNIILKEEGYLTREITPKLIKNYGLVLNVFLSVDPFGSTQKLDAGSRVSLFSLFNPKLDLSASFPTWAEGIRFTQKQFTGAQTRFDALIDPDGKLYIMNETEWKNKQEAKSVATVGFLATSKEAQLTEKAVEQWQKIKSQFN